MNKKFEEAIVPNWSEIPRVLEITGDILRSVPVGEKFVDTVVMVVCELVENAIKYGSESDASATDVNLSISVSERFITIQVSNRIDANAHSYLRELDRILQWVKGFQDPFEAYIHRISEVSREPITNPRSCLGITRIAYEAQADLDFYIEDDSVLRVSAIVALV